MYALEGEGLRDLLSTFHLLGSVYGSSNLDEVSHYLPGRQTVSSHIHTLAENIKCAIKKELYGIFGDSGPGGAISLDIWSDNYLQKSYIGVIAHYIDEEFNLKTRVIANEPMSSERKKDHIYIKEKLNGVLLTFQIGDTTKIVFVSDRGANVIAALNGLNHTCCADHFVSNNLEQCFSEGRPKDVWQKAKKIVKFVKKSGKNDQFHPSLKSPSKTRWNYAYTMFKSLVTGNNWAKMTEILTNARKDQLMDDFHEEEVQDMVNFLEIFHKATLSLEATTRPTIHRTSA